MRFYKGLIAGIGKKPRVAPLTLGPHVPTELQQIGAAAAAARSYDKSEYSMPFARTVQQIYGGTITFPRP